MGAEMIPLLMQGSQKFGQGLGSLYDLFEGSPYDDLASGMQGISGTLKDYLGKSTAYMQPYEQAGRQSLGDYMGMLQQGRDPASLIGNIESGYQKSPGAQFQEHQGLQDISTGAAARGLLGSGSQARSMMKYGTNLANTHMNDYLNQVLGVRRRTMGGYSDLAGRGQQAAGTMGNWTYGTGQNLANLQSQIAQARAMGKQQQESTVGNFMSDIF